jgi:hypothetical protein
MQASSSAHSVAVFFVKCINAAFIQDGLDHLAMQFRVFSAMHDGVRTMTARRMHANVKESGFNL